MKPAIKQTVRRAITIACLLAGATGLALAHHAYSAFDMTATRMVTGNIKKLDWTNPHTWVWIDVPNEKGVVETWGIEGMSPNYLARRGWSRTTLKPGDKISLTFHPMKDGSKGGSFMSATKADGTPLQMGGAITDP